MITPTERYLERFDEQIAALQHKQWSGWMDYLMGKSDLVHDGEDIEWPPGSVVINPANVERWLRQKNSSYEELPEDEKKSDRIEAAKVKKIMAELLEQQQQEFTKTLNSGRAMYEQGKKDAKNEMIEMVGLLRKKLPLPEPGVFGVGGNVTEFDTSYGFNEGLDAVLSKLKEEEK